MISFSFVAVLLALYFAPTIAAMRRRNRNTLAVFAVNLLFGWTLVAWAGALVWAVFDENEVAATK